MKRHLIALLTLGTLVACRDVETGSISDSTSNVEATTIHFVAAHRDRFKLRDARKSLSLKRTETDALGMTHARFQQTVRGVPVIGAEIAAHYDREGRVAAMHSTVEDDLDLDVTPSVERETSRRTAIEDALARTPDLTEPELEVEDGALAIEDGKLVWSWRVRAVTSATPAIWAIRVDAKTGAIASHYNALNLDEATGKGSLGDTKKIEVTKQGAGFVMQAVVDGVTISTFDAQTKDVRPGNLVSSESLDQWDAAAVDAHFYAANVVKYYKERHARNSIDGVGGSLVSTVHYLDKLNNAFWDGRQMSYGDGDGVTTRSYAASMDIVAHELSHGVTERTSNLQGPGMPGALNEAWSDIMGACFSHFVKPDPLKNWVHGLDKQIAPIIATPARYLADPSSVGDPAHMDDFLTDQQDNGQVHANSNIVSHAMYLMTAGGTNRRSKVAVKYGIGFEKAEKIWYRANTQYWLTKTTFEQAAQGVMQSAKDLGLTPNEQNIVECGFKAVGIVKGECAELTDPSPQTTTPDTAPAPEDPTEPEPADEEDDDDDETETPSKRTKKSAAATPAAAGCNASGSKGPSGEAALLALAVAASLTKRRRRT